MDWGGGRRVSARETSRDVGRRGLIHTDDMRCSILREAGAGDGAAQEAWPRAVLGLMEGCYWVAHDKGGQPAERAVHRKGAATILSISLKRLEVLESGTPPKGQETGVSSNPMYHKYEDLP